jgi:hypothetical protein
VQPSWSEGGTTRYNFGRGPSNDYFIKVWFQLSNWFQTRRFPQKPLGQLQPNFGGMILGWPLPKLCPVISTSNQDGRQAKIRKKGGMKLKKNILF